MYSLGVMKKFWNKRWIYSNSGTQYLMGNKLLSTRTDGSLSSLNIFTIGYTFMGDNFRMITIWMYIKEKFMVILHNSENSSS